ncbi:hypothetical protein DPMN_160320 [Dreissena polymorpha]|uniref:Uncharacterized protein n=1 Tax=Dreissena polymorpha TaxID=45954 RepID=A0A9D4IQ07_DREPO|nr:hypothetical protein DPMN_160320 [Dreissena polymorpha]
MSLVEKEFQQTRQRLKMVMNWPVPINADELRLFVALVGYYRRYVKDFSVILRPLNDLLPPTSSKKNAKRTTKPERIWTKKE